MNIQRIFLFRFLVLRINCFNVPQPQSENIDLRFKNLSSKDRANLFIHFSVYWHELKRLECLVPLQTQI